MIDIDKIKDSVFEEEETEKEEVGVSKQKVEDIVKTTFGKRRYISDPSEAPEGANVQEGPQGGYFIDDNGGGGGGGGGGEGGEGGDEDEYLSGDYSDTLEDELRDGDTSVDDITEATGLSEERVQEMVTGEYRPSSEDREAINEVIDGSISEGGEGGDEDRE